jgi:hypothetical protein
MENLRAAARTTRSIWSPLEFEIAPRYSVRESEMLKSIYGSDFEAVIPCLPGIVFIFTGSPARSFSPVSRSHI